MSSLNSLTPGEIELLHRPGLIQDLIKTFDAIPIISKTFKTNTAISSRVGDWLTDAHKPVSKPRSVPRTILDMYSTPIVDPRAFNDGNCPF